MAIFAIFGFLVGCYGVFNWITNIGVLSGQPAVVAVPQLILFALQALLGFLLAALAAHSADSTRKLGSIEAQLAASTVRPEEAKTCPDCAEMVRRMARVCRFCRHEFWGAGEPPNFPPLPALPRQRWPGTPTERTVALLVALLIAAILIGKLLPAGTNTP